MLSVFLKVSFIMLELVKIDLKNLVDEDQIDNKYLVDFIHYIKISKLAFHKRIGWYFFNDVDSIKIDDPRIKGIYLIKRIT